MPNDQDKAARAAYFKELRELHELYNKHVCQYEYPGKDIWPWRVGICSCGKLIVRSVYDGNDWVATTHGVKRKIFRKPGVKKWYKVTCNHDKQRTQSPA